jgi:IclR family mhp operon transcriptional activator
MKTINTLERGLLVLQELDELRGQSLAELYEKTGIPKATLLRILETLRKNRFIWRAMGDGCYRRTISIAARRQLDERTLQLAEIAAPFLVQLQKKVIWPSDLTVPREGCLELVETSRRYAGLGIAEYELGYKVDMFLAAPSRAYLAFCREEQREAAIARARANPPANPRSRQVLERELDTMLAETRAQGYGARDPLFGGSNLDKSLHDDQLDAIAVPIFHGDDVIACISLLWPRKFQLRAKLVQAHLADLKESATAIGAALAAS